MHVPHLFIYFFLFYSLLNELHTLNMLPGACCLYYSFSFAHKRYVCTFENHPCFQCDVCLLAVIILFSQNVRVWVFFFSLFGRLGFDYCVEIRSHQSHFLKSVVVWWIKVILYAQKSCCSLIPHLMKIVSKVETRMQWKKLFLFLPFVRKLMSTACDTPKNWFNSFYSSFCYNKSFLLKNTKCFRWPWQ